MVEKAFYLKAMGIERWRLRGKMPTPCFYRFELFEGDLPVGLLVADVVHQSEAEQKLVLAIAKSTKKIFSDTINTVEALSFSPSCKVIISLGDRCVKQLTQINCPLVVSYSPAELLADPSRKAETWQAIKKAMALMDDVSGP